MATNQASQRSLDHQLERVAWALFLIMLGGLGLVPAALVPAGAWLVGTGLIMLGLNLVRTLNGIQMRAVTIVLGVIALSAGLSAMLGVDLPVLAILLILIGVQLLYQVFAGQRA